ncbi:MAG: alginate lyase family protein [Bacteroidales bacterium]
MKIIKLLFVAVLFILFSQSCKKQNEIISLLYDDELLIEVKKAIKSGDENIVPLYNDFIAYVDSVCLSMEPLSVVKDKKRVAPSKDPRDYITLSPYWWPDPSTPDGLPYIRKDGERNPEVYEYNERVNSTIFAEVVQMLSIAFFLTEDEKYASKVAEMLRVWFLDPVTGMNPNMTYSQTVPGMTEIRGTGIIDARRIAAALNAAKIVEQSKSWTKQDREKLLDWANAFRYWLENSVNGLKEAQAPNNHGLWYEVTHQALVLYSGNTEYLKKIINENQIARIDSQMQPDGSLPHELARTLGLHYSTFALEALNLSDIIASKAGLNLWDYKSDSGKGMILGLEFLKPFWQEPEKWPHMQIKPFNMERGALLLYSAGRRTKNQDYIALAKKIGYKPDLNEKENSNAVPRINSLIYYRINIGE